MNSQGVLRLLNEALIAGGQIVDDDYDGLDAETQGGLVFHTFTGQVWRLNGLTTGSNEVRLVDNLADSLSICQSTNDYLVFDTTNSDEKITVGVNLAIADGKNIVLDSTTGTKIGTAITQKLSFFNATPIVQRAGAAQGALVAITGGEAPTEAEHNAVITLVNELRAALVAFGLIKGAA